MSSVGFFSVGHWLIEYIHYNLQSLSMDQSYKSDEILSSCHHPPQDSGKVVERHKTGLNPPDDYEMMDLEEQNSGGSLPGHNTPQADSTSIGSSDSSINKANGGTISGRSNKKTRKGLGFFKAKVSFSSGGWVGDLVGIVVVYSDGRDSSGIVMAGIEVCRVLRSIWILAKNFCRNLWILLHSDFFTTIILDSRKSVDENLG